MKVAAHRSPSLNDRWGLKSPLRSRVTSPFGGVGSPQVALDDEKGVDKP